VNIRARAAQWLDGTGRGIRSGVAWLEHEARLTFDGNRWAGAVSWRDRAAAVSWPRAGVAGALTVLIAGSLWVVLQPDRQPGPPRLPTDQEWRASQSAAAAMQADLSPTLAAANRSEPATQ